jgi:N-acetyl-alpha-D-muramate 1-phosphate uridylyltransferase
MPQMEEQVLVLDEDICGVVLAAGAGTRLRPLTWCRPKPLCPMGGVPLLDLALARLASVTTSVAVNLHHDREAIGRHLAGLDRAEPVHRSVEENGALGTAGGIAHLAPWIDGRATVVVNADTWCPGSLAPAVAGWDRGRVRVLVTGGSELTPVSGIAGILLPWWATRALRPRPTGLYEVLLQGLAAEGELDVVRWDGPCLDCGTPARYLAANMVASGGRAVIGDGAKVLGRVTRSVVWDGATVEAHEHLVDAVRTDCGVTVLVR